MYLYFLLRFPLITCSNKPLSDIYSLYHLLELVEHWLNLISSLYIFLHIFYKRSLRNPSRVHIRRIWTKHIPLVLTPSKHSIQLLTDPWNQWTLEPNSLDIYMKTVVCFKNTNNIRLLVVRVHPVT